MKGINKSFTHIAHLRAVMGDSVARLVRKQPGFRVGPALSIQKTSTGGYRLFHLIGGTWMDASLEDVPQFGPQPSKKRIQLRLEGGIIELISKLPMGIELEVQDFDVEGTCPDDNHPVHKNKAGEEYYRRIYGGRS